MRCHDANGGRTRWFHDWRLEYANIEGLLWYCTRCLKRSWRL